MDGPLTVQYVIFHESEGPAPDFTLKKSLKYTREILPVLHMCVCERERVNSI
jgi:hypothetical protein